MKIEMTKGKALYIIVLPFIIVVSCFLLILYYQTYALSIRVNGAKDMTVKAELNKFLKDNHIANAAVSLGIIKNGKESEYYFGVSSFPFGKSANENTMYEIGSITKTFTATLIQKEITDGRIKLDDPVNKYLTKAGRALPSYHGKDITIRDLLTHTSQLPKDPPDYSNLLHDSNPCKYMTFDSIYSYLKDVKLNTKPGSSYYYSNIGYAVLGDVLTTVTGKSFCDLMKSEIFNKLKMSDTSLALDRKTQKNMAQGYGINGSKVNNWEFGDYISAGGIYTDLRDMMKWLKCNIYPEKTILHDVLLGSHKVLASAWNVTKSDDMTTYEHGGLTGGYRTEMIFSPNKQIGMVLLIPCNQISSENTLAFSTNIMNILEKNL